MKDMFGKLKESVSENEAVSRFLTDNKDKIKKFLIIAALFVGVLIVAAVTKGDSEPVQLEEGAVEAQATETVQEETGTIYVDIGGEVTHPKLAELPAGSRVEDAIDAAGGITSDADMQNINRAEFLEDGAKIYIPKAVLDEDGNQVSSSTSAETGAAGTSTNNKININTADSTQLQNLNGVGPVTAQNIIDYRTSSGKFKTIEDIKNVSGIGDKTFEKLKDYITV